MTVRIQWDRYEIALLFSTYERVAKGADINIEAAKLSETLRALAIRRSVSIEDTYRNVNGMKMQLANVQYLFTDGEKGLSGASSLIRQMYELYRDVPAEYQKILKEASRMAGTTAMTIEDAFFAYAKERIGLTPAMLTFYLEKAADFCHLKQPLLGMTDVRAIHNVQQKVAGGKLLRFRYGKDAQTIRAVTQLYYTFVKSYRDPKEELLVHEVPVEVSVMSAEAAPVLDTTDADLASNPQTAVMIDTSEEDDLESNITAQHISATEEYHDELLRVDFSQDKSYLFTKPISYSYRGLLHDAASWISLYVDVCGLLFDDYRDAFMGIMNGDIPGHNSLSFADEQHKSSMRVARCFSPGFYLESNIDATMIVRRIRGLHQLFHLGDDLQISYVKLGDSKAVQVSKKEDEEWLIYELRTRKITYVDNRSTGGCLWIVSGVSTSPLLSEATERGYRFHFKQGGCRAFPNRPVMWTKDQQPAHATPIISTGDALLSLDAFREFLIKEKGFAEPTARNYWTSIRMIEAYIQRDHLETSLLNTDASGAQRVFDLLMTRPDFRQINIQRHRQFSAALTQYVSFLQKGQGTRSEQETASSWAEYEAVLKQAFPKGFQKGSGLDIKKLRRRWTEVHGKELKDPDEIIRLQLAAHCVDTGKRWYLSELLLSDKDRQTVLHYIDRVLSSGKQVLYYSSIYAALEHQLESAVLTEDLLASYLQSTCGDRYILRDHYLSNDRDAQVDLYEEIKDVMLAHGGPIHTDELKRALHHLPPDQVERELRLHPEFIMDALQVYFHESMVDLTDQELDQIAFFIQEELDDQGYMIGDRIQWKLAQQYPETAERLSFLTPLGVRGAVAYKLRDRFTFSGPVITPKGRAMNMSDIFSMFCQRHVPFTLDEISAFAKECDSTIYMNTVHENCARVDETNFVAADAVHWDIPHIDAAIALYCPGKYVPVKDIQYFDAFPFVGYPWNSYLLEQYVATVSKDFMLMHSSYAKETTSGAIVRRDAGYERFDDLLADILANAPVPMEQSPCLEYLAGMGYITRRRIANIAEIITKARALRSQRG